MTRLTLSRSFVLAAVSAALLPGAVAAQQPGLPNIAIVRALSLDSELFLRRAQTPDEDPRLATLMESLNGGDFVQTSVNTRAAIQFTDDLSVIRMNPETIMEIRTEGERGAMTKIIDIQSGEFWAQVNRRDGSEFRIQTPTAVAAVRGTEFIVRVENDGRTTIITLEGLLDFFTDVGTVQIPAGNRGVVGAANEAPVVDATPQSELTTFQALSSGEGLGASTTTQTQQAQWETIEIPMTGPDGRTRIVLIQVPVGTTSAAGGGE